jgi:hypothetical protein
MSYTRFSLRNLLSKVLYVGFEVSPPKAHVSIPRLDAPIFGVIGRWGLVEGS